MLSFGKPPRAAMPVCVPVPAAPEPADHRRAVADARLKQAVKDRRCA
jgi:hypothetical protein